MRGINFFFFKFDDILNTAAGPEAYYGFSLFDNLPVALAYKIRRPIESAQFTLNARS